MINPFVQVPDRENRRPGRPDRVSCAKVLSSRAKRGIHEKVRLPNLKDSSSAVFKRISEIALIMDTPFVEIIFGPCRFYVPFFGFYLRFGLLKKGQKAKVYF